MAENILKNYDAGGLVAHLVHRFRQGQISERHSIMLISIDQPQLRPTRIEASAQVTASPILGQDTVGSNKLALEGHRDVCSATVGVGLGIEDASSTSSQSLPSPESVKGAKAS